MEYNIYTISLLSVFKSNDLKKKLKPYNTIDGGAAFLLKAVSKIGLGTVAKGAKGAKGAKVAKGVSKTTSQNIQNNEVQDHRFMDILNTLHMNSSPSTSNINPNDNINFNKINELEEHIKNLNSKVDNIIKFLKNKFHIK